VSPLDGRGLLLTLSHYCPTVAASLFDDVGVRIVEAPPAFPRTFEHDPLDAREALPLWLAGVTVGGRRRRPITAIALNRFAVDGCLDHLILALRP
jgi:hypothetical protein